MKNNISIRWKDGKYKALTLSYDDGTIHDRKMIEILDKYGIKCTFNLNNFFGKHENRTERIIEEEIKTLYKNHEVAIHGMDHIYPNHVPCATFAYEIIENRRMLEKMTGKIVRGMAYAYGRYNEESIEVLKACNIKYSRTTKIKDDFEIPENWLELEANCHHKHEDMPEKCDKFLELKAPEARAGKAKLFYMWGHSYEFGNEDKWEILENFCKKMSNKDDIWYATNGEIYDYVQAFNRLEFNVDCSKVHNPTAQTVWFCADSKPFKINPAETIDL